MWMVFVRLNLPASSCNQKKENISSKKGAFFGILFVFLPCRLIRFQQKQFKRQVLNRSAKI